MGGGRGGVGGGGVKNSLTHNVIGPPIETPNQKSLCFKVVSAIIREQMDGNYVVPRSDQLWIFTKEYIDRNVCNNREYMRSSNGKENI